MAEISECVGILDWSATKSHAVGAGDSNPVCRTFVAFGLAARTHDAVIGLRHYQYFCRPRGDLTYTRRTPQADGLADAKTVS